MIDKSNSLIDDVNNLLAYYQSETVRRTNYNSVNRAIETAKNDARIEVLKALIETENQRNVQIDNVYA